MIEASFSEFKICTIQSLASKKFSLYSNKLNASYFVKNNNPEFSKQSSSVVLSQYNLSFYIRISKDFKPVRSAILESLN